MNRIACWALVLLTINIADQARSAESGIAALENCFKASRLADSICSNPENPPQRRLDCFKKAQAAQLECLEHTSSEVTGSTLSAEPPGSGASQAPTNQPKTADAPVQAPAQAATPPVATAQPEVSPVAVAPAAPAAVTPPGVSQKTADAPADEPGEAAPPSVATASPTAPPKVSPVAVAPAAPAAITPPNTPDKTAGPPVKQSNPDWVVSETASPIDYSPVVIATLKSSTNREDSPTALSIQCRQRRTEIALRTDGAWRITPNSKVQVALQMKDRLLWNLSANGKIATNADRAVELIQSLSEGTTLMVTVSDGVDHAAVFHLTGLDAVRKRILAACQSTPLTESKASLVKH